MVWLLLTDSKGALLHYFLVTKEPERKHFTQQFIFEKPKLQLLYFGSKNSANLFFNSRKFYILLSSWSFSSDMITLHFSPCFCLLFTLDSRLWMGCSRKNTRRAVQTGLMKEKNLKVTVKTLELYQAGWLPFRASSFLGNSSFLFLPQEQVGLVNYVQSDRLTFQIQPQGSSWGAIKQFKGRSTLFVSEAPLQKLSFKCMTQW